MFCPKCGKNIGSNDRFCRYCGAAVKGEKTNNSNSSNPGVKISINGHRQSHRKKGNVLGAIQRAYKTGTLNYRYDWKYGSGIANEMTEYVLKSGKASRYDIEQTIHQIIDLYKSGALNYRYGKEYGSGIATERIWDALKR